jgi:hypothetical protein
MKLGENALSSVVSGLAIRRNGSTVAIVVDTHKAQIDDDDKVPDVFYECSKQDARLVSYSQAVQTTEGGFEFPNGVRVALTGDRFIISTDSGTLIWLNKLATPVAPSEKVQSFLVHMSINQPKVGYMEGMCGNFDGMHDQSDDFSPKYIVAAADSLFECNEKAPGATYRRYTVTDLFGSITSDPDDRDVYPTSVGRCSSNEKMKTLAPEVCHAMCKSYTTEGVRECDNCKKDYCFTGLSNMANMAQSSFDETRAFVTEVEELKGQDQRAELIQKSKRKPVGGTEERR